MMRQASGRNQRSKGLRVKTVLRRYLLAAACLWLLYQLKHSYDKKRAPEERNLEASEKIVESQPEVLKFGRKDLPRREESGSGNDTHDKEEDNQEFEEEEEEEEEGGGDQEIKQAMEDEEAGDDEINERDQERTDEEEDQERADEEAENGEELTYDEDEDGRGEETEQLDDQDTEEDSFNEAHEESYKRDDASGANEAKNYEDEDGDAGEKVMESTEEKVDTDDMADGADDASKVDSDLSVGEADASRDHVTGVVFAGNETNQNDRRTMNRTVIEKKGSEFGLNISEGFHTSNQIELHANSTTASVIKHHIEAQSNSTSAPSSNETETQTISAVVIDAVADSVPLQNETVGRVLVQNHSIAIEMGNSEQDKTSFKNVVMRGLVERSNRTVGQEDAGEHSFVSSGTSDNRDAIQDELAESWHRMVTEEERDARTDPSTLPAMQNEVMKVMVGEAAERW